MICKYGVWVLQKLPKQDFAEDDSVNQVASLETILVLLEDGDHAVSYL